MTFVPTHPSVTVIGGGQAWMSVAFYLKRLGLEPEREVEQDVTLAVVGLDVLELKERHQRPAVAGCPR